MQRTGQKGACSPSHSTAQVPEEEPRTCSMRVRHAGPGATCLSEPRAGRSPGPLHGMPDIEVSSSAETDPVAGFKPGTKAEDGGKSGKHLLRGRPPAVSLHSQLAGSGEEHLPPASWQPAAPPRTAAASQGKRRSPEAQPCPGRDRETVAGGKTLPSHPFFPHTPALCVSQGRLAAPAVGHTAGLGASSRQSRQGSGGGEGLTGQHLQGRSTAPHPHRAWSSGCARFCPPPLLLPTGQQQLLQRRGAPESG